ncbi:hypothetical protein [Micromonospora globispora]|uniref:hypothetical protein n=1 Tax=Micromonospora globispora TaxID=1450148 RepID=UPI000F4E668E|nr:hypothetical protein [Micromonospora globispora]
MTRLGELDGRPVVVKVLTTDDPYWAQRFAHEHRIYQALEDIPPPVLVPALQHIGEHVLVVEHLPRGRRAHRTVRTATSAADHRTDGRSA